MHKLIFIYNTGISSSPLQFVFCSYWRQINQKYICEYEDLFLVILDKCIISTQGKSQEGIPSLQNYFPTTL